ncbi:MAG: cupin [Acidimicrobiales bacterium]
MLSVGLAHENWTGDARFHEYTKAADPIGNGTIPPVPGIAFSASLHTGGPTREVVLDLSGELGVPYPATSPALLASFVCIRAKESFSTRPDATSELYYVLHGHGASAIDGLGAGSPSGPVTNQSRDVGPGRVLGQDPDRGHGVIEWSEGDFVTLPAGCGAEHRAGVDAVLYHVVDSPLLAYLGVTAHHPRFLPTVYRAATVRAELDRAAAAPEAAERSRIAILLANAQSGETLTVTHTLWAMFGLLPAGKAQLPHRHQSVALDLIIDCEPGCFSMVGDELDDQGRIVDPVRFDWEPGGAFVTPPGKWHSHHNTSKAPAHLIPVQDAGLHTYLRTLDIRFFRPSG